MEGFFADPQQSTWEALIRAESPNGHDPGARFAFHFERYNEARVQRDLPNSMSRDGRVEEHIIEQMRLMKAEFEAIKRLPHDQLWELLSTMCRQRFDEEYVWTAAEIALRLLGSRLAEMARSDNPENAEIIEQVRQRFRAGHGRIGLW